MAPVALLALGVALAAVRPPAVPPRVWVVDPAGVLRSVAAALAQASPGDRILVRQGLYHEPRLVITKRVELVGEGEAVLDGGGAHEVLTVRADSVVIRNLTVQNVGASYTEDRAGIRLDSVRACLVEGNHLRGTLFGIYVAQSSDCRIIGNRIEGAARTEASSGNAVHLWHSSRIAVEDNLVSGHRDGIYLEFTEGARIARNTSRGNLRYGLHFMFSHDCEYVDNLFADNHAGVAVMYSHGVVMRRNRFERAQGSASFGLLLKELSRSTIEDNVLSDNSVALFAEGTSGSTFVGNQFLRNGWAVRIMGDATDNRFTDNRFVGNSFDVATNSTSNNSRFGGNYWDHYDGYDLDRDGRGDVPFHPVRLFALIVERNAPALVLLRSAFIDLLDAAERAFPVLTPETLVDEHPLMRWSPR